MIQDAQLGSKIQKLWSYCQANDWAGYDPYDATNSNIFAALPFLNSRIPRLVLTQALKRSPLNFRRLLRIPRTQNPKAIALFLSAFLKLERNGVAKAEDLFAPLIGRLVGLRSNGVGHCCWRYSFPYQPRTMLVPGGAPD